MNWTYSCGSQHAERRENTWRYAMNYLVSLAYIPGSWSHKDHLQRYTLGLTDIQGDPRDAENRSRAYNRHSPGFLSEDGGEAETLTTFLFTKALSIIKNLQSQYISFPQPLITGGTHATPRVTSTPRVKDGNPRTAKLQVLTTPLHSFLLKKGSKLVCQFTHVIQPT